MSLFGSREGDRRLKSRRDEDREARRVAGLIDSLPAGLMAIKGGGRIAYSNHAAKAILGFDDGEEALVQTAFRQYPALLSVMELAATSGRRMRGIEVRLTTPHRGDIYLVLDAHMSRSGDEFRLNVVFFDITRIKEREEELRVKDRLAAIGEVSATLAHQIKSPLANILMYLERSTGWMEPAHPAAEYVATALSEAERLDILVRTLLDTIGPARVALAEISAASLVNEIAEMALQGMRAAGARLLTEIAPDLPAMKGDSAALKSAFLNLIENAVEAGATQVKISARLHRPETLASPAERVTFSVTGTVFYRFDSQDVRFPEEAGGKLEVIVADDGHGVGPGEMNRLFTPFFTTKTRGTGLGLVAVLKIVEAHHGGILFKSKQGKGSEVIVYLPCHV